MGEILALALLETVRLVRCASARLTLADHPRHAVGLVYRKSPATSL
jgi:hypothetical protein